MAGVPAPTRADTFEAASAAPVVTIIRTPNRPFQPAYTNSAWGPGDPTGGNVEGAGRSYTIDVTVTEANGANDIETVELCVFDADHADSCSPATEEGPDPRWAMLLRWTRPVDADASGGGNSGFAKAGWNNYALDETSSWADEVCAYDGPVAVSCTADRFHTDLHFVFYVSDAMHAGGSWNARVIATNSSSQSNGGENAGGSTDNVPTMGVSYFGWVTTARTGLDYGTIEGTYKDWQKLAMGGRDYPASSQKLAGNEQIAQEVARNKNGIGYVGLAYAKAAGIKTIVIDGVQPVAQNAKKYAYSRPCFFYAPDKPTPEAAAFLEFAASAKGLEVVRRVGFVPASDL